MRHGRRAAAIAAAVVLLGGGVAVARGQGWLGGRSEPAASRDPFRSLMVPGCGPAVVPAGQATPPGEPEPLRPVWCYRLPVMAPTRVDGENSWVDTFDTGMNMGRFQDGDMGYRVFPDIDNGGEPRKSVLFLNQDHWMVDTAGGTNGGVLVRPDRSFRFQDGTLVIEADVAAGLPAYSDSASVEVDVSTAPAPTGHVVDEQYGYGLFGGQTTFGCRFQADRQITCSLFNASGAPGDPAVFGNEQGRVWQMLPFQHVGTTNVGGDASGENGQFFRECDPGQMDLFCRDRFRIELTKDSVRVLVNGHLYFEQSGISPKYQLPPELLDGNVYTYFTSWVNRPLKPAYRFHWDRVAVNPAGPPAPALSFGLHSSSTR